MNGPIPPEWDEGDLPGTLSGCWICDHNRTLRPNSACAGGTVEWLEDGYWLDRNDLQGELPAELVNLTTLTTLYLNGNQELTGPLSDGFAQLTELKWLHIEDTDLCVPTAAAFVVWLGRMQSFRGSRC